MAPSSTKTAPIKLAVLGALGMAFAWGVIAGSVGLNALIKSNQEKSRLRKLVPSPTVLTINVDDVFHSGIVVTTVSALIALISFLFIAHLLLLPYDRITRTFRIQGGLLAFFAIWLFATLIPFTHFVATRSANVTATLNGVRLPASLVQRAEQALGSTSVYKKIGYLRLVAILPWFTFLFTVIAAVVLFIAASRSNNTATSPVSPTADTREMVDEKNADVKV